MKLRERLLIQSLIREGILKSEKEIYEDDCGKSWLEVVEIIAVNVEEELNAFYEFGDEVDKYAVGIPKDIDDPDNDEPESDDE